MSIEDLKRISIREFLSSRGITPRKENPRGGMYLSPLREERTPSFSVDYVHNLWYDHGLGRGGSIIDLVMALQNCDLTTALRSLGNSAGIYIPTYVPKELPPQPPAIEIQRVRPLSDPRLLYYLKSRSISPEIAFRYCREVYYKTRGERVYFAVGFRNDGGGWELRNSRFKISTSPKTISTLSCGSDTVAVFEGFMDYLSYMSMRRERRPGSDAIVLNSVSNLSKAMTAIASHATILTYLDNDEAGRRTTEEIRRRADGCTVIDRSELYKEYNDLNDYWKANARDVGMSIIR